MPSSNKTTHLQLNSFIGSDKPKMDDFNYDNQKIDAALGEHLADAVAHLTAQERQNLNNQKVVIGSYTGNGMEERDIPLGCTPQAGIVFALGQPLAAANPAQSGQTYLYAGGFSTSGSSLGLTLTGSTLRVEETVGSTVNPQIFRYNTQGTTYLYLVFRP